MIICGKCGKENADEYIFCLYCGADLRAGKPAPAAAPAAPPVLKPKPVDPPPVVAPLPPPAVPVMPPPVVSPVPVPPVIQPASLIPAAPAGPPPLPTAPPVLKPAPVLQATPKSSAPQQPAVFDSLAVAPAAPEMAAPWQSVAPAVPVIPAVAAPSSAGLMSCPSCGALNLIGNRFCGSCGGRLDASPTTPMGVSTPAAPSAAPVIAPAAMKTPARPRASLTLLNPDGSEGRRLDIPEGETIIGRDQGTINFDKDPLLSPKHAVVEFHNGLLRIRDAGSLNGIYRRIVKPAPLEPGSRFLAGRQLFVVEDFATVPRIVNPAPGDATRIFGSPLVSPLFARVVHILDNGYPGRVSPLDIPELTIGREGCDLSFPVDPYMSARHCAIEFRDDAYWLRDLGSANGTFLRLTQPADLYDGQVLIIGSMVMRFGIHNS
ncbi:MAG: hypothetical protein GMKNLPBB_02776 [Myxococcota bacterium]|nr:hypothetical protein [Myxococcota bacterium]